MRFRVLGPLTVVTDDGEVLIGGNKLRVVLAGLLLCPGETVPVPRLASWLWDGEADDPDRARATVHTYVNRLRGRLGRHDVIRTARDGYRAEVDADSLDLLRFRELARSGRQAAAAGDLTTAARLLSQALDLWRGPVLADVDSPSLHAQEVEPLVEEWLRVQEQWLDIGLRTGKHADLVPKLRELTRDHPLREPFWERLMIALHRSGRHAEALQTYQELRELLAEELGVDPGPSVRETYQAILTEDPAVAAPETASLAAAVRPPVPRQLRPDIPGFAGRRAELAALDGILREITSGKPGGPRIVSLQGTAGAGKTALAIHWAHRVSDHFPDGQLYLDLHGHGPERPVDPAVALESLLRALGTPADRIPTGLDERAALFRTLMTGRRALILLDNARNSEQIRPLIPNSDGMVLITSRNQLRGFVVQYGARRIVLDQMPPAEATELLAGVIGPERAAAEPEAVAEIVERCARLPLALRIFAERAARFPHTPLRDLVAELRDERTRLATLHTGDGDDTDLRMVFSWTYNALEPQAARLFRLLGVHPGPEISVGAAAALAGREPAEVTRLLDRLTADHLLRSRSPGRYDFHDLLRAYAAERAREEEDHDAALRRVLDWYLHTAHDAAEHLPDGVPPFSPGLVPRDVRPHDFDDPEGAVGWYEEELPNLMAATHAAAARGWTQYAWRLPRVLSAFLDFHVPGPAWAELYRVAAEACRAEGELREEGVALNHLAQVYTRMGDLAEAVACHGRALEAARRTGDRELEGEVLIRLGTAEFRRGRPVESTECYAAALAIARESGDRHLEAEARVDIAQNLNEAGQFTEALKQAETALRVATATGDRYRRGEALRAVGTARAGAGRHAEAAAAFREALTLMRQFEDRRGEADLLTRLGHALRATGDLAGARERWREALAIFTELDDDRATAVRRALAEIGPRAIAPRQEHDPARVR